MGEFPPTEQNRTEQNRTEQNRTEQNRDIRISIESKNQKIYRSLLIEKEQCIKSFEGIYRIGIEEITNFYKNPIYLLSKVDFN